MTSGPGVLITGVSGTLGRRLLSQLTDIIVAGADIAPPPASAALATFATLDLGTEASCRDLVALLRETGTTAVVHLAFAGDHTASDFSVERRWQINVAGTARVMEAITEVNRQGGRVTRFIVPTSATAYGPELNFVTEESRLAAHTLPSAIHHRECDEVAQRRAVRLGECATYILRTQAFAAPDAENYRVNALRGAPAGPGRRATRWRAKGKRAPLLMPTGDHYLNQRFQVVHVEDVARLITWLLRIPFSRPATTIVNVAASGEPITMAEAVALAGARVRRLPTMTLCRRVLKTYWNLGVSPVPPEALPFLTHSSLVDTSRLRDLLRNEYKDVIRYSSRDALADTFPPASAP